MDFAILQLWNVDISRSAGSHLDLATQAWHCATCCQECYVVILGCVGDTGQQNRIDCLGFRVYSSSNSSSNASNSVSRNSTLG